MKTRQVEPGVLGEYSSVIENFIKFSNAREQDLNLKSIVELSEVVHSLKYYYCQNELSSSWKQVMANIFSQETNLPSCYTDLLECFENTLDISNPRHLSYLAKFMNEIDLYVRGYNLTIRDLVRMNNAHC